MPLSDDNLRMMARLMTTVSETRVLEVTDDGATFDGAGAAVLTAVIAALLQAPEKHSATFAEMQLLAAAELLGELPVPTRIEEWDAAFSARTDAMFPDRLKRSP